MQEDITKTHKEQVFPINQMRERPEITNEDHLWPTLNPHSGRLAMIHPWVRLPPQWHFLSTCYSFFCEIPKMTKIQQFLRYDLTPLFLRIQVILSEQFLTPNEPVIDNKLTYFKGIWCRNIRQCDNKMCKNYDVTMLVIGCDNMTCENTLCGNTMWYYVERWGTIWCINNSTHTAEVGVASESLVFIESSRDRLVGVGDALTDDVICSIISCHNITRKMLT